MPNGLDGVKMIYPTKKGATNAWYIHDGFENDPRVRMDEKVSGDNVNGYKLNDNSKVRIGIFADKDVDIGCKNDFSKSYSRGFVYKETDWTNVEMTGFFKATIIKPSDNGVIFKGPTGEHHSNTTCCSGSSYNTYILQGSNVKIQFSKETYHVNYKHDPIIDLPEENYNILGHGWYGFKHIHYIKEEDNKKVAVTEIWYNADGLGQNWRKVGTRVDSGGWGKGGDVCNGAKDQILAWGNSRMIYRWDFDKTDIVFRDLSVREIDPFASFEDNDDTDTPETTPEDVIVFEAELKLQRHINYNDGIGCGVTGGSPSQIAYDIQSPLSSIQISDNSSFSNRTRGTECCNSSSSKLKCIPKQLDVFIIKNNSPPASPTISAKIWDSSGNVKATSSTTIDPTTLPTSFGSTPNVTFNFSSNTYQMQVGDRIGIEYLHTSSSNYIKLGRINSSSYDGENSIWIDYEDGVWDESPTRDLAGTVWK